MIEPLQESSAEAWAIRERAARQIAAEAQEAAAHEAAAVSRLQAAAGNGERVDPAEFQDAKAALELAQLRSVQLDQEVTQAAKAAAEALQAERVAALAARTAADPRLDLERLQELRNTAAEAAEAYRAGLWDYLAAFEELSHVAGEIGLPTLGPGEDGDGLFTSNAYSTGGPLLPTGPIVKLRANGVTLKTVDAYTLWGRFAAELAAKK